MPAIKRSILSLGILLNLTIGFFFTPFSLAQGNTLPDYWPTHGWRVSTPESQGMDSESLIEMMELIRNDGYAIDSITVVRNGYLVLDTYAHPFEKDTKHLVHSVTKSFVSTLIGIAIDQGLIKSVKQPAVDFFPEKRIANLDEQKKAITLEHLLMMSSGLESKDSYKYDWSGLNQIKATEDRVQYILSLPMKEEAGENFEYASGNSHLLSAIINQTTQKSALEYAKQYLFEPLGITDVVWPSDPLGINTGGGGLRMLPRDMAKLGLLYLYQGQWNGQQIVSKDWVEVATKKHSSPKLMEGYGYQWWIDAERTYIPYLWDWGLKWGWQPSGAVPYFIAAGFYGQFIFVVPEKKLVAVFTSDLEGFDMITPKGLLDQYIIPSVQSSNALEADPLKEKRLEVSMGEFSKVLEKVFVWRSEREGVAKSGEFVRSASPAFRFSYPKARIKKKLEFNGQIMAMRTLEGTYFDASALDIPENMALSEMGPKVMVGMLQDEMQATDIQVLSNKAITLGSHTEAYWSDIEWLTENSAKIKTLMVSAFKDEKWVFLTFSIVVDQESTFLMDLNVGISILESLRFE